VKLGRHFAELGMLKVAFCDEVIFRIQVLNGLRGSEKADVTGTVGNYVENQNYEHFQSKVITIISAIFLVEHLTHWRY
jgi:hypothetical protein